MVYPPLTAWCSRTIVRKLVEGERGGLSVEEEAAEEAQGASMGGGGGIEVVSPAESV